MNTKDIFMSKAQLVADELFKGRDHVELSIGLLDNGVIETVHFDETGKASDDDFVYPVGSINKLFTASLLAKHIAAGDLSLDTSMEEFFDALPERYYPSILRLMTHHSGYGGAPFGFIETLVRLAKMNTETGLLHVNPFRGYPSRKDLIELVEKTKLTDKEYKFAYSNLGYGILGYIGGKLEGSDFFTAMNNYFKELGLERTSLSNSDLTGYDKRGNPCKPWQWESTDAIAPAGAMLSSAEDLLKFAAMNMDGTLPYTDMMFKPYASGEKTFEQGLAWRLKKNSDICFHVGSAGAFSCILAIDRTKKRAAVIELNYALVEIEDLAFSLLGE